MVSILEIRPFVDELLEDVGANLHHEGLQVDQRHLLITREELEGDVHMVDVPVEVLGVSELDLCDVDGAAEDPMFFGDLIAAAEDMLAARAIPVGFAHAKTLIGADSTEADEIEILLEVCNKYVDVGVGVREMEASAARGGLHTTVVCDTETFHDFRNNYFHDEAINNLGDLGVDLFVGVVATLNKLLRGFLV